jgi:hypothetical protein
MTRNDYDIMMGRMLDLQQEIAAEIEKPELDPGRLMRLTAAGVNQCIMAMAVLLSDAQPLLTRDAADSEPCGGAD